MLLNDHYDYHLLGVQSVFVEVEGTWSGLLMYIDILLVGLEIKNTEYYTDLDMQLQGLSIEL